METFLKSSRPSSEVFVAAFYFSSRDKPENQSLQAILAFTVEHLLSVHPRCQKYYNKPMLTGEGPLNVADSLRIIHRARQDFQHFCIILDALDECGHQKATEVPEKVLNLHRPLRIFATSRPEFDIKRDHLLHEIEILEEVVQDGVKAYVWETFVEL